MNETRDFVEIDRRIEETVRLRGLSLEDQVRMLSLEDMGRAYDQAVRARTEGN